MRWRRCTSRNSISRGTVLPLAFFELILFLRLQNGAENLQRLVASVRPLGIARDDVATDSRLGMPL